MVDVLRRACKHFENAKAFDVMLGQLAGDSPQVAYIDAIAMQDSLELPTAQGDLFEVFESTDDRFNLIMLQFSA